MVIVSGEGRGTGEGTFMRLDLVLGTEHDRTNSKCRQLPPREMTGKIVESLQLHTSPAILTLIEAPWGWKRGLD